MEKHSQESQDPLLPQPTEENSIHVRKDGHQSIRSWLRANGLLIAIFSLLLYIATALTIDLAVKFSERVPKHHDSALLGDIVQYEERTEWYPPESPFNGEPSDELDAAWDDLLFAINMRVTDDELDILGIDKTNRVKVNGGDNIASMGVYHHLHCLNNLRMVVHWDYYKDKYVNTPYFSHFGTGHSDHCINALRQAVMCHANTAITTFEWVDEDNDLDGKVQRLETQTTCAKWDSVDNWARQRSLQAGNYTYRPGPFERNKHNHEHVSR
ncbi:hypothetical protein M426DRAFT_325487 [Hypoxylon sp. CI-4A]|nr:hypothetical protein M426DRAFT_325487 [Hypoxylon sp. CI-4A]